MSTEHAVAQSQAQCFVYDAASSSWKALAEGLVNLYLYHHPGNKSYRVIGMNAQQQVVINSSLFPECRYSHSNNVFHTWTDTQFAYGIHFAAEDLAKKFSADFASCIAALNKADAGGAAASAAPPPPLPDSPSASAAPGSAAGMSLAEQIAAKKLKKAEDRPEEERPAPPPSSGGGGGNLMGELASALTRRSGTGTLKTGIKAKVASSSSSRAWQAPAVPAPESPRDVPPKPEAAPAAPATAAPAAPVAVAGLVKGEGGTPVGTPGAVRKKVPGGAAAPGPVKNAGTAPSPAAAANAGAAAVAAAAAASGGGGGGGLSKADLDKLKEELLKAFRDELAAFKTQLLADISGLLAAQTPTEPPPPAPPAEYYEEEEGY